MLSRIANFDDLDPLRNEPAVTVEMIPPGTPLPSDATLVLIPGSKSTIADLAYFKEQGWDIDLRAHPPTRRAHSRFVRWVSDPWQRDPRSNRN